MVEVVKCFCAISYHVTTALAGVAARPVLVRTKLSASGLTPPSQASLVPIPVGLGVYYYFPRERTVYKCEVACREHHPDDPPDQSDLQPVDPRFRARRGQRGHGIPGGQHHGIDAKHNTRQHPRKIGARRKKRLSLVFLRQLELHSCRSRNRE